MAIISIINANVKSVIYSIVELTNSVGKEVMIIRITKGITSILEPAQVNSA
jgi:hypothetical protein